MTTMPKPPEAALHQLCAQLQIEEHFFIACLEESVIEVHELDGRLELANGTILRLRRLQRICLTFDVDIPVALMLSKLKVESSFSS
jgi:hypothetical protein